MNKIDFPALWQEIQAQFRLPQNSIHGPSHWRRVERNGLYIAQHTPSVDKTVIRLFAVFHDSRRQNDGLDSNHGGCGADLAREMRGKLLEVSDRQFDQLIYACQWHTDKTFSDDPTIGACWDADRLDLGRASITPKSKYLNSKVAKRIADSGDYHLLRGLEKRI